jgi:ATP-dependent protease ClpP protease subunit
MKRNYEETEEFVMDHYAKRISDNFIQTTSYTYNTHIIYIDEGIEAPNKYREVCKLLIDAQEADTIVFVLNTPGGYVDSALQIIDHIKLSRAKVVCRVYDASSAGTWLMLACHEVYLTEYAKIFIHGISQGMYGKMQEIQSQSMYEISKDRRLIKDIYKNFLTEKEIEDVINNKDIYLDKKEAEKRLEYYFKVKSGEISGEKKTKKSKKSSSKKKKKK